MNEDVFPIENGDFPMSCWFSGVQFTSKTRLDTVPDMKVLKFICRGLKHASELVCKN